MSKQRKKGEGGGGTSESCVRSSTVGEKERKNKVSPCCFKNIYIKKGSSKGGRCTHARTCACPKPLDSSSPSSSISFSSSWTPSRFSSQPRASSWPALLFAFRVTAKNGREGEDKFPNVFVTPGFHRRLQSRFIVGHTRARTNHEHTRDVVSRRKPRSSSWGCSRAGNVRQRARVSVIAESCLRDAFSCSLRARVGMLSRGLLCHFELCQPFSVDTN